MLGGLPLAKGDMHFGCCAECPNRVFAFMQRAHALDLDGHGSLERGTDCAGFGCASGFAQDAIGAFSRVQLDGLQEFLPGSTISFFCLRGHRTGSSPARSDDPARDRLSRIETMRCNRTAADFVVRQRLHVRTANRCDQRDRPRPARRTTTSFCWTKTSFLPKPSVSLPASVWMKPSFWRQASVWMKTSFCSTMTFSGPCPPLSLLPTVRSRSPACGS